MAGYEVVEASKMLAGLLVDAGLIDEETFCPGETIGDNIPKDALVRDVCECFSAFYGRPLTGEMFDELMRVRVYLDGDCDMCGGELEFYEDVWGGGEGPDSYLVGKLFQCSECGRYFLFDDEGRLMDDGKSPEEIYEHYEHD